MTRRTIPVEKTVQEPVYICDFCGESEDDKPNEAMIPYRPTGIEAPALHLHEGCVEAAAGNLGSQPEDDSPGGLWVAYSYVPAYLAVELAKKEGRTEPNGSDVIWGWIGWIFLQVAFLVFLLGGL